MELKDMPRPCSGKSTLISIKDIVDVEQTQIRESYDEEAIKEFERLYRNASDEIKDKFKEGEGTEYTRTTCYNCELPYLYVVKDPEQPGKYWIVDGHHRYKAALNAGEEKIIVNDVTDDLLRYSPFKFEVKDLSDLHFLQGRENIEHIANRTNETKRRQVEAVLYKRPHWTDSQIALYSNVSRSLVATVRKSNEDKGNIQTKQTAMEKAQDAIDDPENVGKSNVQIAKEIGVNEKTVREARKNVENQNSEGEEVLKQPSDENLKRVSQNAQAWLEEHDIELPQSDEENYDPQSRPTLNKVTKDSKRVKPEIENPTVINIKPDTKDSIPLSDTSNISTIVEDVLNYLGSRAETFRILLNEIMNEKN